MAIDLAFLMGAVRALGIRGCSISMPFKQAVIPFLDQLDPMARQVGAVNTVLNEGGQLTGFNTDVVGARQVLAPHCVDPDRRIVVLGAGGVAMAILYALAELNMHHVTVCARRPETLAGIQSRLSVHIVPWADREAVAAEWLINATPIGMTPHVMDLPIAAEKIAQYRMIMDVVATPPISRLIHLARLQGIPAVDGFSMTMQQAAAQFTIYTGHAAPFSVMETAASNLIASMINPTRSTCNEPESNH